MRLFTDCRPEPYWVVTIYGIQLHRTKKTQSPWERLYCFHFSDYRQFFHLSVWSLWLSVIRLCNWQLLELRFGRFLCGFYCRRRVCDRDFAIIHVHALLNCCWHIALPRLFVFLRSFIFMPPTSLWAEALYNAGRCPSVRPSVCLSRATTNSRTEEPIGRTKLALYGSLSHS